MILDKFLQTDTAATRNFGYLGKFSQQGLLLWQHKYIGYDDSLMHYVLDVKATTDGGFVLAGRTNEDYRPNLETMPWSRAWLLKVDSNGCSGPDDPQCWPLSVPEPDVKTDAYQVYPNPVNETLRFKFTRQSNVESRFLLSDVTGRTILFREFGGQNGQLEIDVRGIPAGMYIYRIVEAGRIKQSGKLSKQ